MPLLINRAVTEDSWLLVDEADFSAHLSEDIVVPYELFAEHSEALLSAEGKLGVRINGDQDLNLLLQHLDKLALIAVEFPAFTDGRGFSFARILRRSGFAGQLRAEGDVTRDRLEYMERCGFDAFAIPADRYSDDITSAFGEIPVHYQGCADDERPIFRQ
ncbi:DUF934 domain-containing protein [Amphritea pacifica]|uniref:DUF934 domain-containing protein n=1 Tax=Amphritea pacifica TaxID=2811233 RepID=A0ABS2WA67_9GAMM|nr:DUF934 domain-containing protein [Amphritea pacifica]MBN0988613.1 DUF934 domain-containing protein [Amphritea pacifica]MBN1007326.1 DUF934 domain-containing protein [Amphritea pacifica]